MYLSNISCISDFDGAEFGWGGGDLGCEEGGDDGQNG